MVMHRNLNRCQVHVPGLTCESLNDWAPPCCLPRLLRAPLVFGRSMLAWQFMYVRLPRPGARSRPQNIITVQSTASESDGLGEQTIRDTF